MNEDEQNSIRDAIKKHKLKTLLILGTSDGMVHKIQENLNLPKIQKIIYIEEVVSEDDIKKAIHIRKTEGKHIVPVPTFEIKKDFSGILLDQFRILKGRKRKRLNITKFADKSIIRPKFSYLGKFTIKDKTFKDIINIEVKNMKEISSVNSIVIDQKEGSNELNIYLELTVFYGYNIFKTVDKFNKKIRNSIETATAINNIYLDTKISNIDVNEERKKIKLNRLNKLV